MRYISFLLLILISCSSNKKIAIEKKMVINQYALVPAFDFQGHRGCRGLMPENTIPAMLHALDLGVTTLEMDVVITKDSQVVVSHDPYFNHDITTKPDGSFVAENEEKQLNIFKMTYDEVKQFDVGMKLHPRFPDQKKIHAVKPLLSDLIDSVENYITQKKLKPVFYNIETKCTPYTDGLYHPAPNTFVELLMKVITDKKMENRTVIQSFDIRSLRYLHERFPAIRTALLIEDFDKRGVDEQLRVLGFDPTIYSPHYSLVTNEIVEKCHEKGIKVIPWTVNDVVKMKQLKAMRVDGIISDYPDLFRELK